MVRASFLARILQNSGTCTTVSLLWFMYRYNPECIDLCCRQVRLPFTPKTFQREPFFKVKNVSSNLDEAEKEKSELLRCLTTTK